MFANGREFLSIPGPTTLPDRVLQAMHRPAIPVYAGEIVEITDSCVAGVNALLGGGGYTCLYAANGHGVWEAALVNILSRGDRVLALQSGQFADGWGRMGETLGLQVERLGDSWQRAVDPGAVEARLRADRQGEIKAVLVVQVDTASGVVNDIGEIRAAMDAAGHGALLVVDAIASLATMPFRMADWRVDVAVAASQKGLMTSPGLGITSASERALAAHRRADLRTGYWDWSERDSPAPYIRHCGTAPQHLLFGLREALAMIAEEGTEQVFRRHRLLAAATHAAVAAWSEATPLAFNVSVPSERAGSVTTILAPPEALPRIHAFCRDHCNIHLGVGIGQLAGKAFRIAHMGHCNAPMQLGTLGGIEVALVALGICGTARGTAAAVHCLAEASAG